MLLEDREQQAEQGEEAVCLLESFACISCPF
uniref:Uncharacterized protein n=1 Tax=Anguilla anguilla TaxID=7936 RepID=A0A0E9TN67_ANGAN